MKLKHMYLSFYVSSILATLLVGATGWWGINKTNKSFDTIVVLSKAQQAATLSGTMQDELHADVLSLALAVERADETALKTAQTDIKVHTKQLEEQIINVNKALTSSQIKADLAAMQANYESYIASAREMSFLANENSVSANNTSVDNKFRLATQTGLPKPSQSAQKTRIAAIGAKLHIFLNQFSALETQLEAVGKHIENSKKATQSVFKFTENTSKDNIIISSFALTVCLTLLAWLVRRGRTAYIGAEREVEKKVANDIANGDLSKDIHLNANDTTSLLKDFHKMQHNLRTLVWQIQTSAGEISVGAQQISAGNTNLSQRTEEQASSLEETASSMEQMASTVKQNAENAKQANIMANEASSVAVKGGKVVNQVVNTMSEINSSSKKIVDIISVIDGIAFQTNILALNAAVEAARAGEQGRGFAVVAAEVRSLAQRSATAAKEIKQLISDSVEKVGNGMHLVQEAGATMDEVVTSVKLVTDIVNEIAAASQEQSAGIDQVNHAITNMDEVTQQNAALVEQASAAASALESKAFELIDATAKFKLTEDNEQRSFADISANLNAVKADTIKALSAKQTFPRNRLKVPIVKKDEGWEEF